MENTETNPLINRFEVDNKEILIIGTAHVSKESAELVSKVIENEQPDTVCVELCNSRFQTIRQKDKWQNMDIVKVIKEKKALVLLLNLLLASFQKKIADKFEIKPGQEMLTAIDKAEEIDAHIHLADREIQTTLTRTLRSMSFWEKTKFIFQIIFSLGGSEEITEEDVEKMKQEDVLETLLSDVKESHPVLQKILIDERDRYLAHKIKNAPGEKIVAVVGAGHTPGIKKYWDSKIDIDELDTIPPKGKFSGLFKWLIPTLILVIISLGFYYGGSKAATDMIWLWILANGVLAGIGAIVAFGHPVTIVSAVVAAPLTSLNPMIAAGFVSGLVEAYFRQPKVMDLENLSTDIQSIKGFWKNKVTKILLVFVLTNLGSSIGTFIALPLMMNAMG